MSKRPSGANERMSHKANVQKEVSTSPLLTFRPLTPRLMDDLGVVFRGNWGTGCWCIYPRMSDAEMRELPGPGSANERRREAMKKLARRRRAPGLLAFEGDQPVAWIAIAPRSELGRVDRSRATPRVDDEEVWVIPCITVLKAERGRGIALALIEAAVTFAIEQGAPAIEAYPRAGAKRTGDDNVFFGTEPLFRRAGFRVIRKALKGLPRNWIPRVTMRCTARGIISARSS